MGANLTALVAAGALSPAHAATLAELHGALRTRLGARLERFDLFGSRARGEQTAGSDVDVAIVVRGLTAAEKLALIDLTTDVELRHGVVVATWFLAAEQFAELQRRERRIALDLLHEGIPL